MSDDNPELVVQLQQLRDDTDARFHQLETALDELDIVFSGREPVVSSATSPAEDTTRGGDLTLLYPSLQAWVVGHFARVYVRSGGGWRWCAKWWDHAEAISRLQALWRSWEILRVEPLGMDTWLREHLDHHLPQLMHSAGPFSSCTNEHHRPGKDLPTTPAPDGWWDLPQFFDGPETGVAQ
ncbi:DUF4913 domain-containing protein [Polymorphospora sp. NPDC050346]|uniref:DUF4913 domain-containing protein n=1 Tax=Polymorphospora sp. NPDC050346 TaxID=3155780 RepID=UPI0033EC3E59